VFFVFVYFHRACIRVCSSAEIETGIERVRICAGRHHNETEIRFQQKNEKKSPPPSPSPPPFTSASASLSRVVRSQPFSADPAAESGKSRNAGPAGRRNGRGERAQEKAGTLADKHNVFILTASAIRPG
jgi:hypothetical protein